MVVERRVVTEVTDEAQIAELRWHEQGDAALEEAAALEQRHANRESAVVKEALELWWEAATRGSFEWCATDDDKVAHREDDDAAEDEQRNQLDESHYKKIFTKIGVALLEEDEAEDGESALLEARELAAGSWLEDAKGKSTLRKRAWLDSMFELADTW